MDRFLNKYIKKIHKYGGGNDLYMYIGKKEENCTNNFELEQKLKFLQYLINIDEYVIPKFINKYIESCCSDSVQQKGGTSTVYLNIDDTPTNELKIDIRDTPREDCNLKVNEIENNIKTLEYLLNERGITNEIIDVLIKSESIVYAINFEEIDIMLTNLNNGTKFNYEEEFRFSNFIDIVMIILQQKLTVCSITKGLDNKQCVYFLKDLLTTNYPKSMEILSKIDRIKQISDMYLNIKKKIITKDQDVPKNCLTESILIFINKLEQKTVNNCKNHLTPLKQETVQNLVSVPPVFESVTLPEIPQTIQKLNVYEMPPESRVQISPPSDSVINLPKSPEFNIPKKSVNVNNNTVLNFAPERQNNNNTRPIEITNQPIYNPIVAQLTPEKLSVPTSLSVYNIPIQTPVTETSVISIPNNAVTLNPPEIKESKTQINKLEGIKMPLIDPIGKPAFQINPIPNIKLLKKNPELPTDNTMSQRFANIGKGFYPTYDNFNTTSETSLGGSSIENDDSKYTYIINFKGCVDDISNLLDDQVDGNGYISLKTNSVFIFADRNWIEISKVPKKSYKKMEYLCKKKVEMKFNFKSDNKSFIDAILNLQKNNGELNIYINGKNYNLVNFLLRSIV